MDTPLISTNEKARSINVSKSYFGTIAEIGAGQEISRWFFKVGGASGTADKCRAFEPIDCQGHGGGGDIEMACEVAEGGGDCGIEVIEHRRLMGGEEAACGGIVHMAAVQRAEDPGKRVQEDVEFTLHSGTIYHLI